MGSATAIEFATYVVFDSNFEEALDFYKTLLGGELVYIERDPERDNRIVQATFVATAITFIALDNSSGLREGKMRRASLFLKFSDLAEGRQVFEALAKHGEVERNYTAELGGVVYDRFGIRWIVKAVQL